MDNVPAKPGNRSRSHKRGVLLYLFLGFILLTGTAAGTGEGREVSTQSRQLPGAVVSDLTSSPTPMTDGILRDSGPTSLQTVYLEGTGGPGLASLAADDLVLDTVTNVPSWVVSSTTPRSYMGDPFSVADLGGPLEITGVEFFVASTTAQTFAGGLCLRIQFWENYSGAANPVFSGAVGDVMTLAVPGPASLTAGGIYTFVGALPAPLRFDNRTNNGFVVNYQGNNGYGCVDIDTLTSLIRYAPEPNQAPIAVGSIPLSPPKLGYYRNTSNLASFNFGSADLRVLSGTNSNAIAIRLYGRRGTGQAGGVAYLPMVVRGAPTPPPSSDSCYRDAYQWGLDCKNVCSTECADKDCYDSCDAMTEAMYFDCPPPRPSSLPSLPPHAQCFEGCAPQHSACLLSCDDSTCSYICDLLYLSCACECYKQAQGGAAGQSITCGRQP